MLLQRRGGEGDLQSWRYTPIYVFPLKPLQNLDLGPVYIDKSCPGQKVQLPNRTSLGKPTFYRFPYKTWRTFYMGKETGQKALSPFFAARFTLLAGPTFLLINTLARPARATLSWSAWSTVGLGKGDNFSLI